jgi:hypothetical protein
MDEEELAAMLAAAILSPVRLLGPFCGTVDQGVSKMMSHSSWIVREHVTRLVRAIVPPTEPIPLGCTERVIFQRHTRAIVTRKQVRMNWYEKSEAPPLSTRFSPYQLAVVGENWTVAGRSSRHRKVVRFALKDIRYVEKTNDSYEVPGEFLKTGYTGTAIIQSAIPLVRTIPWTSVEKQRGGTGCVG